MDSILKLLAVPLSRLASLSWNRQKSTPKPVTPKPVIGQFSPRPRRDTVLIAKIKIEKNNTSLEEF